MATLAEIQAAYRDGRLSRADALQQVRALREGGGGESWGEYGKRFFAGLGQLEPMLAPAARFATPFVGGAIGAASPVPGGMYAGSVAGGALGETLGELFGGEELSGRKITTSGVLGLLPGWTGRGITSGLGRVALRGAEGATYGALSSAANAYFGEGRVPTWREVGQGATLGGTFGSLVGGTLDVHALTYPMRLQRDIAAQGPEALAAARAAGGDRAIPPPSPLRKGILRRAYDRRKQQGYDAAVEEERTVEPGTVVRPEEPPMPVLTREAVDDYWAQALPETRVRTPEGKPRRMYHGSPAAFDDFDPAVDDGSGLYGPGFYFTDTPEVASEYAASGRVRTRAATAAQRREIYKPGAIDESFGGRDRILSYDETPDGTWSVTVQAIDRAGNPVGRPRTHNTNPMLIHAAANVRPVYLDIRKPFMADYDPTVDDLSRLARGLEAQGFRREADELRSEAAYITRAPAAAGLRRFAKNRDVFRYIAKVMGVEKGDSKHELRQVLEAAGYDGIFHRGGQIMGNVDHEVAVAFRPEQVRGAFDLPPELLAPSARAGAAAAGGAGGAPPVPPVATAAGAGAPPPPPGGGGPNGTLPGDLVGTDLYVQPADSRAAAKRMFVRRYNPDGTPVSIPRPASRAQRIAAAVKAGKDARYLNAVDRMYANFPPDVRDFMVQLHIDHGDTIMAATGGVQPVTEVQKAAAAYMLDTDNLPRVGTLFDPVQGTNIGGAFAALSAEAGQAAAQWRAGKLTWDEMTAKIGAVEETATKLLSLDVASASAQARGMRMRQEAIEAGLPPVHRFTKAAIRQGATPGEAAKALVALGPDATPRQMMKAIMDLRRTDWREKARSLYISNLLAGWAMIRNTTGNMVRMIQDPLVKPVAAGIDRARVAARGGERRTYAREATIGLAGTVDAVPTALRAFGQILRRGFTDDEASRLMMSGAKFEIPQEAFKGKATPLNLIGRVLRGTDVFFRTLNGAAQHRASAYAEARRELARSGKKIDPAALQRRMGELLDAPTPGMLSDIEMAAARSVFQEPVPAWVNRLSQGIDGIESDAGRALIRLYLPFVNTPANLVRQAVQFSPAGVFTKGFREASRNGDMIRAETALGTLLAGAVVYGVLNDHIRPGAPVDRGEREAFLAKGPENSVRIGDRWVKFTDLGHLGIAIGTVANMTQAYRKRVEAAKPGDMDTPGEAAMMVGRALVDGIGAAGQSVFDQSFLSGMGELIDAISDTQTPLSERAEKLAQRRVTALLPGQAILRPLAYGADPTMRDPKGLVEAVRTQIPGLQRTVPPRLDIFGNPVQRTFPGYLNTGVFPSTPVQPEDPIRAELTRLGVTPDAPRRGDTLEYAHRQWALRPEEDLALRRARGKTWRAELERIMALPEYRTLPDDQRKKVAANAKRAATIRITRRAAQLKSGQRPLTVESLLQ